MLSENCGHSTQLLAVTSANLPPNLCVWSDSSDDLLNGASVTSYYCDSSYCLHYDDSDLEQSVNLE